VTRVRRTQYLHLRLEDAVVVDVAGLLRGRLDLGRGSGILAVSALTGGETPLEPEELELLRSIPDSDWVDAAGLDPAIVERLVAAGSLVSDADELPAARLRRRDELLDGGHWHPEAALFHARTTWTDVSVAPTWELDPEPVADELVEQALERLGEPPPHFHEVGGGHGVRELPLVARQGGLRAVLAARRTTRSFDPAARIGREQLSILLHEVYGCHGTTPLHGARLALKKTSPSGGSLHPIEVYPLVLRAEGVETGLHHYRVRDHALELVEPLSEGEASALAECFVCGQAFFADAAVLFVMTARFARSFWKYRRHDKAYPALLLEAGHLSQTLYLVAAELGLGAFVTAAVNAGNVEERLGLEPAEEGVLAICGCGVRAPGRSDLEPEFEPYEPPRG
jgi:putative peptide maturation dehydrogenase